ncbi:ABC transporter transmembrane domain-containing protein [Paenibacillus sp. T3-5-0-4]|nr:ABC transporter transmembrane domain-containing protein [Paenibacillus endoradicis]
MSHKLLLCFVVLAIIFELAFEYFTSLSMKYLIDEAILPQNMTVFFIVLIIFVVGGLLNLIIGIGGDFSLAKLNEKTLLGLRSDVYRQLQTLSSKAYQKYRSGDLLSRFTLDAPAIEYALQQVFVIGLYSFMSAIVGVVLMITISWKLTIVAVVGSLMVILPQALMSKRAKLYNQSYVDGMEQFSNHIEEEVKGFRTIQAFNLKRSFEQRFDKQMGLLYSFGVKRSFINSNLERLPVMILTLVNVAVLAIGGYFTFQKQMSIGDFTAFNSIFLTFNYGITAFMRIIPAFIEGEVGMKRVNEILELQQEIVEVEQPLVLTNTGADILFNNVSFGYNDNEKILNRISLLIKDGQYVAIVGTSGSGKSTLVQLLLRFYQAQEGSITIQSTLLEQVELESLFRTVGVVFQEPYLFNATLRSNLLLGNADATLEEVGRALDMAGLSELIADLPQGLDTMIVNEGQNFSAGERQRIAIAQTVLRNPHIFIADDITAALDPEAESIINECLAKLSHNRTLIHITHRLHTIMRADFIYVLDRGQLVGSGTHDELLTTCAHYAQMWTRQQGFQWSQDGHRVSIASYRLKQLPFFAEVEDEALQHLTTQFLTEKRASGETIIREGEKGNKFYIIVRGKVMITKNNNDGSMTTVASLEDGEYFGEIALLRHIPRTANVIASTDCVLLTLTAQQLMPLMKTYPYMREQLEAVIVHRMK